jgi:hypothetical protein
MQYDLTELKEAHHNLCVFADDVASRLNDQLVRLFGESADWQHHAGSTELPKELDLLGIDSELILHLWILREGANGICASNNF